jgi:hypothetical protein
MGRFTELFMRKRTPPTAKPAPKPEPTPEARAAEAKAWREAEVKARAAAWQAQQDAEWAERVAIAHEVAVRPFLNGELTDSRGFANGGEIPTLHVPEDGEWVDLLGVRRGNRRLS